MEFDGYVFSSNNNFAEEKTIETNKKVIYNTEKESNKMNVMKGMNFEFGPVGRKIKLSVNGMAFRNEDGNYVTYDVDKNSITDVTDFTLDFDGMLYQMPVAINQIKKNDVIVHKGDYVIAVADYNAEKGQSIEVVNPITQTTQTILPTQNIFGFNFITKVVNLAADMFKTAPDAENPFGNIMPMIMMSTVMGDNSRGTDMSKLFAMNMMMQNGMFTGATEGDGPFAQMMPFMMMKGIMNN